MLVDIDKIVVKDRIRKDFGDIQELADDIKQNGLINPPVVNKEYELLAGERRLRACKSLGWKQIEVRMMDTRDAEHEFDVEVSENENRKDFSRTEREAIYTKYVEFKLKNAGPIGPRLHPVEHEAAKLLGTSRTNMNREREIIKNKDLLDPSDFADWDEGKLSTNKVFQKVKKSLAEKEATIAEKDRQIRELESREPEVREVVKEIMPDDYPRLKEEAIKSEKRRQEIERQKAVVGQRDLRIMELEEELKRAKEETLKEQSGNSLRKMAYMFMDGCETFLHLYGGNVFMSEKVNELSRELTKEEMHRLLNNIKKIYDWSNVYLSAVKEEMNEIS